MSSKLPGKRGPLARGDTPLSHVKYKCKVINCNAVVRGDRIQDHYKKNSHLNSIYTATFMSKEDGNKFIDKP